MAHVNDWVHFRASGVSVVLTWRGDRLPSILHWGADLGDTTDQEIESLIVAAQQPRVNFESYDRPFVSVLPETADAWMNTPGLVGHRAGVDHSPAFRLSNVTVDEAARELHVTTLDEVAQLELSVRIALLPSGLLRAKATIASTGNGSADGAPYTVDALTLLFPVPNVTTELLDFTGRWIRERTPQRHTFNTGTHVRETRRGKPAHDSAFLLSAGTPSFGFRSGEVWSVHTAWSGNTRTLAERTSEGASLIGGSELLMPGEIQLSPGETYESPWIYGSYGVGLDQVSARFHEFLRTGKHAPQGPRPVIVNTWEAVYFNHQHEQLFALADAAAEVGAERFVLDDGWFKYRRADNAGLGDWYVDEGVYPEGLEPIAKYVRDKGLRFGLWFEPEMINLESDLARKHPEWIVQPTKAAPGTHGRLPLEARTQQVLDLTHPAAFEYIKERLHTLIADLQVEYIKWDHNRDVVEQGNSETGRPMVHGQTVALYALIDSLLEAFPTLEIETCAGGGGRIDLEILSRTHRVWASDCNDPLERQQIQRYTQLIVPPEMMGAHIGPPVAHTTHRAHGLDLRGATALWGHLGIEWNVASPEASEVNVRAALKEWISLHKQFRELLHSGTVVRSDLPEVGRSLHGVVSHDRREALYGFIATDSVVVSPVGALRLEGLDADTLYEIRQVGPTDHWGADIRIRPAWWTAADNGQPLRLSGRVLGTRGIEAPALLPEQSVLVSVTAL